jgi:hypothetical protein
LLSPNPNAGTFTVTGTINSLVDDKIVLQVTDITGKVIYRTNAQVPNGVLNTQITLGDVPDGMYLLQAQSGEKQNVLRFVIRK